MRIFTNGTSFIAARTVEEAAEVLEDEVGYVDADGMSAIDDSQEITFESDDYEDGETTRTAGEWAASVSEPTWLGREL